MLDIDALIEERKQLLRRLREISHALRGHNEEVEARRYSEELPAIKKLWEKGKNQTEMARELNLTPKRVRRLLVKAGFADTWGQVNNPNRHLRNSQRYLHAYRLRQQNKTFNEIGSALGVTGARARQMFLQAERRIKHGTWSI